MQVTSLPALPMTPPEKLRSEATEVHTRLLRLALGVEDSRSYWEHVDPSVPALDRAPRAFEERWFGAKSMARIRFLLACFVDRYDAFPEALAVLRGWRGMDAATRQAVCHWHLQLSDPMYRRFTSTFLYERRKLSAAAAKVDRDVVLRWVQSEFPGRWSDSTCVQFASKLLSAASEAGLVSDKRALQFPKVTDVALLYLLHLLRGVRVTGTLTDNAYLASVGLTDEHLDHRLRGLPGIGYQRMAHLTEFDWAAPDLTAWAETIR